MAANAFLAAALKEEQALLRQLEQYPEFKRLQAVRNLIQAYSTDSEADQAEGVKERASGGSAKRGKNPKTVQVINAVRAYLLKKQARAQSGELLNGLREMGIEVGGKKPTATLAAYLSNAKDVFDNVRDEGFGLVEWAGSKANGAGDEHQPHPATLQGLLA